MLLYCDSTIVGKKTGETKNGRKWYLISILDCENDRHLNFFVNQGDYEKLQEDVLYRFHISLQYHLKSRSYIVKFFTYEVI